jgi:hypothetical protein
MAAIPITIVGTLTSGAKDGGSEQVTLVGIASLTGLEVGGGPMPGGPPLGFWGGRPPEYVDIGGPPPQPGIWPSPGVPTHPIVLPPDLPPTLPPPDDRPIEWKAAWTPTTGWVVVGVPQGPVPTPSKKK